MGSEILPASASLVEKIDDETIYFRALAERFAVPNLATILREGLGSKFVNEKTVWEATKECLNRAYGKPRETLELTHKVKLLVDVPGWSSLPIQNPSDIPCPKELNQ
ncbi:MAG: hypothetical protein PHC68_14450 [Syntrophorhabdaceae bacterium]|nr:hypothetical protein [Syntrophorhabdaceae bacterium]